VINLFCGYDQREAIGWHVFVASVLKRTSAPVAIHRLDACGLPQGTNAFTFSRFLVPWLMGYREHAIFVDGSDMLMLADVAELDSLFDDRFAVQVVKHPNYETMNPVKYVGTSMECENKNYARKNWASVMILNCEHPYWRLMDHRTIDAMAGLTMLQFGGLTAEDRPGKRAEIGGLPPCWNVLADEGHPLEGAKLLHWTAGIPAFWEYKEAPGAEHWHLQYASILESAL
jgi:hypothetical protein